MRLFATKIVSVSAGLLASRTVARASEGVGIPAMPTDSPSHLRNPPQYLEPIACADQDYEPDPIDLNVDEDDLPAMGRTVSLSESDITPNLLLQMCIKGSIQSVQSIIKKGADPNTQFCKEVEVNQIQSYSVCVCVGLSL